MKYLLITAFCFISLHLFSQTKSSGILTGNIIDEKKNGLEGATVQLLSLPDSTFKQIILTDKDGSFDFAHIQFGIHRLKISFVGFQTMVIDSIHFRNERFDFNLNDITLKATSSQNLDEVIIYAEKPLIQSKDGNITFNAAESALSAGSNAGELLTNVPLVTKDPDGKILVRGKEPKILIDDKPVELNQQQLQDLLESLPGSSIEKIEVMTNPPPEYASEQGGVINITTRKGKVGKTARINISAGTRGDRSINGNYNYRKQGLAFNINAGGGYNQFEGSGFTMRQNFFGDSSQFNTNNGSANKNFRPNLRANIDYDINKFHLLNLTLHYNQNSFDNTNETLFRNVNRFDSVFHLSERFISNNGMNLNPNLSLTYTLKTKKAGESLKLITNANFSSSESERDFYLQYLDPNYNFTGRDSSQNILNDNKTAGYNLRLNYSLPLNNKKTFLSAGSYYNYTRSHIDADATFKRSVDGKWVPFNALINEFLYKRSILNFRGSVKQVIKEEFSTTAGLSLEQTNIHFDLYKTGSEKTNEYLSFLPFASVNKSWKDVLNLTLSYRRTIRRPGVNELNPTIDSSDLYHIRSGNIELKPSIADNIDLVLGKTKKSFYANLGFGYNSIKDVFNAVRISPTEIIWQNSSNKKEYEVSTWSGYTLSKNSKINLSASYTYNEYSKFDKTIRKFRNGGSFTSNLNTNYTLKEIYTATGSFTFNRFSSPQGTVRSNLSMNIGLQAKLMEKRMNLTLNFIDPFRQQNNKTLTYGNNFFIENYNLTGTRNIRLTLGYNFIKSVSKKSKTSEKNKNELQKALKQAGKS